MSTTERKSQDQNEGEGSRTADRQYTAGVARTVASGKVEELADKAQAALEGPEGPALKRAEEAGAKGKTVKASS